MTWHVIFWLLLPLGINSIAQPYGTICGLSSRYRIYLSSSPIICLANSISALIRLCATALYLGITPNKASQLVILARSDYAVQEGETHSELAEGPSQSHTGPRWMFFVIGTLPAAIKLASFSKIPWTKTWGMMFVVSFAITELVTVLSGSRKSKHNPTVPAILGADVIEWREPRYEALRSKTALLTKTMENLDVALFSSALLAHLCLTVIAIIQIGHPTFAIEWSNIVRRFTAISRMFLLGLIIIVSVMWLCSRRLGHFIIRKMIYYISRLGTTGQRLMAIFFIVVFLWRGSVEKQTVLEGSSHKRKLWAINVWLEIFQMITLSLAAFIFMCDWLLSRVCSRWPFVAKALLITPMPTREAREQPRNSDVNHREEERPVDGRAEESSIHGIAMITLLFFLVSLALWLLWCVFAYDPIGTINPPWMLN